MSQKHDAERLRQEGHRLTPQRLMVLDVVARSCKHLTADEIHAAVVDQHPYVSIATVYRTLQWLQNVGLVAPLVGAAGPLCYEYVTGTRHHHLVCVVCGYEQEIADDDLEVLKHHLLARYGFAAHLSHLGLTGRCMACQQTSDDAP